VRIVKIIFSVFAIVDNSGFRLFQARQSTSCAHCEILQALNPVELADKIKEKAKEIREDIGVNFQRPIEVLVTGKGEVSGEDYDCLTREEKIKFLSKLGKVG
jgi:hypothetical protein